MGKDKNQVNYVLLVWAFKGCLSNAIIYSFYNIIWSSTISLRCLPLPPLPSAAKQQLWLAFFSIWSSSPALSKQHGGKNSDFSTLVPPSKSAMIEDFAKKEASVENVKFNFVSHYFVTLVISHTPLLWDHHFTLIKISDGTELKID